MDKVIFDVRRKMVLDFVEEKNYRTDEVQRALHGILSAEA